MDVRLSASRVGQSFADLLSAHAVPPWPWENPHAHISIAESAMPCITELKSLNDFPQDPLVSLIIAPLARTAELAGNDSCCQELSLGFFSEGKDAVADF